MPINDIHLLLYYYFSSAALAETRPPDDSLPPLQLLLQFNSYYSVCSRPRTLVFALGDFAGCLFLSFYLFFFIPFAFAFQSASLGSKSLCLLVSVPGVAHLRATSLPAIS